MKKTKCLGLITALTLPLLSASVQVATGQSAAPSDLSVGAAEVVRLSEAGTGDDVVLAYIQNSQASFNLSADQILYLKDIGLSSPVITAMLNRDAALRDQAPQYTYDQRAYPATMPPPAPVPEPAPAPEPVPAPEPAPPPPPAAAPAPVYVSSPPAEVSYFYDGLSPYGSWVQLEGIGWCWQPRVVVVNRAWRPYCDGGHWVYTDAGWYWQSDYSWGWAPFHYGRWHLHARCGWVWLPDRVWGPAWVTWRLSGDRCGWAPLPPHADFDVRLGWRFNGVSVRVDFDFGLHADHFNFVALRDFNDHDLGRRRLPPTEVTKIYKQTTIVNNYVVNNNIIVNQGIKPERVAAVTHTEIRKVKVRDVSVDASRGFNAHGSDKNDMVYRTQLKAPARPPVHMVAQKVDDHHPVIQHAAVAPMKVERRSGPDNTVNTVRGPAQAPQRIQPEVGKGGPQRAPDRSPSRPAAYSAPKFNQPARPDTVAPLPARVPEDSRQPAQASRGNRAQDDSRGNANLSRRSEPSPSNPGQATPPSQASHVYYPKGYQQAAETRSLSLPKGRQESSTRGNPPGQSKKDKD